LYPQIEVAGRGFRARRYARIMSTTVVDHPLAADLLASLRDRSTPPTWFRSLTKRLTTVLILEATRDLPTRPRSVATPLEVTEGRTLVQPLVAVPILRAGLGMLDAVVELFPEVRVGYLGLERDEATFQPSEYYAKLPDMAAAHAFVLDPMLATGGSAAAALDSVKKAGAEWIRMVSVVSAPEGIKALEQAHPDVPVVTAAIDRELNDQAYILPGLGDFGDRLFGTVPQD
jgi:uracil phosphoribosyltransferase